MTESQPTQIMVLVINGNSLSCFRDSEPRVPSLSLKHSLHFALMLLEPGSRRLFGSGAYLPIMGSCGA